MATLDEIRSKLLAQQTRAEGGGRSGGGDNSLYPFWNLPEGGQSFIRFLPDGDVNNTFFWAERLVIKLPFQGVKGEHDREVLVEVPCMEMYGETCPILAETRPWWKDDSLQALARKYWKKKSYLFQGFVVQSGFEEKELPANPIRRFMINTSIFEIIKGSLMNPEMEDLPTDFVAGRDFKLVKTTKGGFANYSTSNWSFKTRSLNPDELGAIDNDEYGLKNLKDYLPSKPTAEQLEAIKEMFQASVNDEAYDPARWSQFYKPKGSFGGNSNFNNAAPQAPAAPAAPQAPAPAPAASDPFAAMKRAQQAESASAPEPSAPAPAPAAARPAGAPDASEILRRIKEKQAGLNG